MHICKSDLADEFKGLFKFFVGLSGKSRNDVCGDGGIVKIFS